MLWEYIFWVYVLLEADPELRIQVQVVYFGSDFRKHSSILGKWDREWKGGNEGCEFPGKLSLWVNSLISLGFPGKPFKIVALELSHPKREKTGINIHHLPLVIGRSLFNACWPIFQLLELHLFLRTFYGGWRLFCPYRGWKCCGISPTNTENQASVLWNGRQGDMGRAVTVCY